MIILTYKLKKVLKIDKIDNKYCDLFSYSGERNAYSHTFSKKQVVYATINLKYQNYFTSNLTYRSLSLENNQRSSI